MNRDKEHCTDSHNECPVIRFIEDVLQVKLLPYQKLLVTHVFETNECKRLNLCSDCRTKMEKKMDDTVSRQEATDALRKMQTYKMFEGDDVLLIDQAGAMTELMLLPPAEPQIIRCKDCKHRDKYGCCKYWKGLAMADIPIATDDNDFCSHAKRKNDVSNER